MIKATRINNTVVCVIEGKLFQKSFETQEEIMAVYEQALNTDENNEMEIISLKENFEVRLTPEERKRKEEQEFELEEAKKSKELFEWIEDIKNLGDEHFRVEGLKLYMKGIDITIPEFLAREFAERRANDEDLKSLQNFWRLCALNPDPRCREDLYKFLINNNMVVTPSGYFLAYRNANVKQTGNQELNEFVGKMYTKTKSWKKGPKNYDIYKDQHEEYHNVRIENFNNFELKYEDLHLTKIGNLQDLYDKISENEEGTIYTDAHSGQTVIKIGSPVSIPRSECDANPDQTCSKGLHLGSTNFMSKGYFGQVGLICLCNPMNVVAVPYTGGQKLRTSEYLPIGIAEYNDETGKIIPVETATFEYEYAEHTEEELLKMLQSASFESLKEHEIVPKELRLENFKSIVDDFVELTKEINEQVKSRVIKAD